MEAIFHEKQEGSLCAQHCLNVLLQAPYFTAVDLATLASQVDDQERSRMAEGGLHSEDYRRFMQQPSSNVDDSGYFSVQVIAYALKVWNLELIPYNSQNPLADVARKNPTKQSAYICNFRDHWFTIRKIGNQWFNLNSLLVGPELISDTYLSLFLAQLQEEGYSIFLVEGKLPDSPADKVLLLQPAVQLHKPKLLSELRQEPSQEDEEEEERAFNDTLRRTLAASLDMENESLQAALSRSLSEYQTASSSRNATSPGTTSATQSREIQIPVSTDREMSEQEMLEAAIKMSMENL